MHLITKRSFSTNNMKNLNSKIKPENNKSLNSNNKSIENKDLLTPKFFKNILFLVPLIFMIVFLFSIIIFITFVIFNCLEVKQTISSNTIDPASIVEYFAKRELAIITHLNVVPAVDSLNVLDSESLKSSGKELMHPLKDFFNK